MKIKNTLLTLASITVLSCIAVVGFAQTPTQQAQAQEANPHAHNYRFFELWDPNSSVVKRIPTPAGFVRVDDSLVTEFGKWMRYFPMRDPQEPLITFGGAFLASPDVIAGVLDLPRSSPGANSRGVLYVLMTEFARVMEREPDANFPSRSGDTLYFLRYVTGTYSTNADKSKLIWKEGRQKPMDQALYERYSEFARSVTTYETLIADCQQISPEEVLPGDLYIATDSGQTDSNKYAAVVVDVALLQDSSKTSLRDFEDKTPQRLFLFANSLNNPATNFHIVRPIKPDKGAWFYEGELSQKLAGYPPGKFYRLTYPFVK